MNRTPDNSIFESLRRKLSLAPHAKARIRTAILQQAALIPQQQPEAQRTVPFWRAHIRMVQFGTAVIAGIAITAGTVGAASGTVPGDPLYPVKLAKEKVELTLAPTPEKKAVVQAKHAEQRLKEIEKIQTSAPKANMPVPSQVQNEAATQVQQAIDDLSNVQKDKEEHGQSHEAQDIDTTIQELKTHAKKAKVNIPHQDKNNSEDGPGDRARAAHDQEKTDAQDQSIAPATTPVLPPAQVQGTSTTSTLPSLKGGFRGSKDREDQHNQSEKRKEKQRESNED